MMDNHDEVLREQLLALLRGGNAHMTFSQAVADFPTEFINTQPPNVEYSFWHLLEHLRITQWDILRFVVDPGHHSPDWPQGYWPAPGTRASELQWSDTIAGFEQDMALLQALVRDPATDFHGQIPHAPGYTILREILLVADHNAYHIGEFGILRQVIGAW
jgi:hypothetical protein